MKVLVCGGSAFRNKMALYRRLDDLHARDPITLIVNGGARGADRLARRWADERGVPVKTYRVRSGSDRRRAFIELNIRMLAEEQPALVLACPGGEVTADLVARANVLRVRTEAVETS
jgi:hypothetical protein